MRQALYRSFRPETFDGIIGQEHIVKIIRNQIQNNTISHAYLFCGTRGTGKTSTARILAKGVNCSAEIKERPCGICDSCRKIKEGIFLDVIEIDAASNNGVENIRELRESVKYPPVTGRRKVYIVDEVHMLSQGAFNALLKTLEEPPDHVMFILATTEPHKLPATILSRCLRLDFRRVSEKDMRVGLREICSKIQIKISDSALGLIVSNSDGSVRDALSLLDQCISAGGNSVKREDVLNVLGISGEEVFLEITDHIENHQIAEALILLNRVIAEGKDIRQFMKDWISHYRSLLMTKFIKNPEDILNTTTEYVAKVREQSQRISLETINNNIRGLAAALAEARWSTQSRILLELCMVKMADIQESASPLPKQKTKANSEINTEPSKPKTKPKTKPDIDNQDLDRLWRKVIENGNIEDASSLTMLRKGTRLDQIKESSYLVVYDNDLAMRFAEENRKKLEDLMEKYIGRRLRMELILGDAKEQDNIEEIASRLESVLETDIEII